MDAEAEKKLLEDEQSALQAYLEHPVTKKILHDSEEQQESLLNHILQVPVTNVETFFAREQGLGHLRGLRRGKALILDDLEEIKTKLKELKQ